MARNKWRVGGAGIKLFVLMQIQLSNKKTKVIDQLSFVFSLFFLKTVTVFTQSTSSNSDLMTKGSNCSELKRTINAKVICLL